VTFLDETWQKVIIDDLKARRVAENMGLKVTDTIGVLMKA
jgi:predicted nucleic acid-binding protein